MAAGATIKIKGKAGAITGGELVARELGMDTTNGALYGSKDGSSVFKMIGADTTDTLTHKTISDADSVIDGGTIA